MRAQAWSVGLEVDFERSYWEGNDRKAKQALRDIREFVDYLEAVKRELCLASARISSDEAIEYIGPSAKVALTGLVHAINYLATCRTMIQEKDLVLTTRALTRLEVG